MPRSSFKSRVVVADDDPDMRRLIAGWLRRDGCEVIEAASGHQLAALLQGTTRDGPPVDLVIAELCMPGPDGLANLARLRASDSSIPVILTTAFGDRAVHEQARRLGAAVLDKPFRVDELRSLLGNVGRSRARV